MLLVIISTKEVKGFLSPRDTVFHNCTQPASEVGVALSWECGPFLFAYKWWCKKLKTAIHVIWILLVAW
jgi:hypothetical protein